MPTINEPPAAVTPAGQSFDYLNPPELASVILVNAPLDPDHTNVVRLPSQMDMFIDAEVTAGRALSVAELNVQNPDHDLQLSVEYQDALTYYNYGRLTIGSRRWYIFYSPEYLNKTTTRFVADIDEWLSYEWSLGYSMIERGHVAVAASQSDTYGAEYLTTPEPIDAPPVRGALSAALLGSAPDAWTVLVVSANDLRGAAAGDPYWVPHVKSAEIVNANILASQATINSAAQVQVNVPAGTYPWSGNVGSVPPIGTPENGYVPDAYLATTPNSGNPPTRMELNTAAAYARFLAVNSGASISGDVAGYWDRALDIAIHADPAGHGVTDPNLSPVGQSPHGLGIRINVQNTTPGAMALFGFTSFNSYTFTYTGPYSWDQATTGSAAVLVPVVTASPVSTIDGVSAGGGAYLFTLRGFAEYMTAMQGAPWVISGITGIRLVPSWAVGGGGDSSFTPVVPSLDPGDPSWVAAAAIPRFVGAVATATEAPAVLAGWRETLLASLGASQWRKLITAQFTDLLVGNGDSMVSFRPDQWQTDSIGFTAVTGAAHGDPSIRIIPNGYNELGSQMGIETPVGGSAGAAHSGYGSAASNVAAQDLAPYLNAFSSEATWQTQFRQRELALSLGLKGIQMSLGVQGVSTALGGVTGAAAGALSGGPVGAAIGAAGAASGLAGLVTTAIQASNQITLLDVSTDGSFDIGAYQLGVSGIAAIASFDTWWQSLYSTSGSGQVHSLASPWRAIIQQAFTVIISVPTADRIAALISEWSRYGYMIGRAFVPPQLNAMSDYTYWQTADALVLGAVPQTRRQTIAGAFNRGVTIWESVAAIGTKPANTPVPGISY